MWYQASGGGPGYNLDEIPWLDIAGSGSSWHITANGGDWAGLQISGAYPTEADAKAALGVVLDIATVVRA